MVSVADMAVVTEEVAVDMEEVVNGEEVEEDGEAVVADGEEAAVDGKVVLEEADSEEVVVDLVEDTAVAEDMAAAVAEDGKEEVTRLNF